MLLRANELVYNQDSQRVTATGGVQIYYNRHRMVAQRVEYDQKTGRVMATGNIELVEPDGNRIYAESLDITDDFGEGFVNSLRVETTDNTRMAAESAEQLPDEKMILNNGVYTACLPCAQRPDKAPLWQVKAQRVIRDGKSHTIRLEHARFELFGMPIGYVPFVTVPDETVERKSGFLFPSMSLTDKLGFGTTVPYYHVFSPSMDATLSPTYYTKQGLLLQGEVRNRFETGDHTLRFAYIDQQKASAFDPGTSDARAGNRAMIYSKGEFKINPRWTFGWNAMIQSDNNFSKTYKLEGLNTSNVTNDVYLTGIGTRNYFDLHNYYFDVQDTDYSSLAEKRQAIVYPVIDYTYYAPEPVAGGELSFNANLTNISRRKDDFYTEGSSTRFRGLEGSYSRFTAEAEWKRTFTTDEGLLITPILAARGDGLRSTASSAPSYNGVTYDGDFSGDSANARYMLTAGFEARYPVLITTGTGTHVIEPMAQVFARPNEQLAGELPNEDAQSFVFDATTLFERDKFSGYDRIEGGTRANVGVRYSGTFDNGIGLRGIFGQSYQLAGQNSFATADLVNVGADSGLESKVSDFVTMAALDLPKGYTIQAQGRFDEKTLELRRADASVSYKLPRVNGTVIYTNIQPQPEYGLQETAEYLKAANSLKINENWSFATSATWDINKRDVVRRGVGLTYADECTVFTVAYSDQPANTDPNDWTVTARLTFRTLGDINVGSSGDSSSN
ncbi:LPS-assembly protein LptD [Rhizobium sp. CSW-27]|uniref:LPS-assembly protein LptD n=1 Tax=Rhizobium sp. CSW-27 TaxID=2839985 RepID=UPI001C016570|nr:LPS-assembly protein LptD [Rhizobium sp. CSW-27]MBT9368452.1 LPS-assembly protein LptD [Rhizobium sp. CSW-27]